MGSLKLTTASSGSVILSPANTASDVTITVPAVTGTMLTNKTAGTVLQVVNAVYSTAFTTSSTSYVSTGLTATITPSSSSNKILVLVTVPCGNASNQWHYGTIYRNSSTNIASGSGNPMGYLTQNSSDYLTTLNCHILDSPSTTSATTYTFYTKCGSGGGVRCFVDNMPAEITLMEIAA